MKQYLVPMAISFVAGSFGYILIQFWLRPVLKYRGVKRKIDSALNAYENGRVEDNREAVVADLRRLADELNTVYSGHLPDWYQLMLKQRDENPPEAAKHLLGLAGVQHLSHAKKRLLKIKSALKLGLP